MFHQLTLGGAQRAERTANTNRLTPGGIPLKIEGVSKIFPGRTGAIEALRPVDVDVAAGDFVCLLGPSGCANRRY
jgi:ABC-type glutathione transport system ATPase component